jgi:hypothetical protein
MPTLPPLPMKRSKQSDKLVAAFAASVAANEFGHNIVKVAIGRLTYRYADAEMKACISRRAGENSMTE